MHPDPSLRDGFTAHRSFHGVHAQNYHIFTPALQKDCVLPISRGGRYTIDNVVPACASCNASKSNDEVTSWMRRKRLDEPRFLVRFAEVLAELRPRSPEA